jgi:hypothetical protein
MRMQIEGLSRRTLRDLDSDYKASAEQNIELEARTAAEHNRELSKRLEARSLEAVELLAAQSGRAKRLRDTRVVREMLADAKREHDARIDKITRQKARAESTAGQEKRAKFPTSKAPISAVFHSFWLIFGRAIISWNGLEARMLFPERARAEHSR